MGNETSTPTPMYAQPRKIHVQTHMPLQTPPLQQPQPQPQMQNQQKQVPVKVMTLPKKPSQPTPPPTFLQPPTYNSYTETNPFYHQIQQQQKTIEQQQKQILESQQLLKQQQQLTVQQMNLYEQRMNQFQQQQQQQQMPQLSNYDKQAIVPHISSNKPKDKKQELIEDFEKQYDPYKILGLQPNASLSDLKKAYKQMALKYHPDKGGNDALFELITKSYYYLLYQFDHTSSPTGPIMDTATYGKKRDVSVEEYEGMRHRDLEVKSGKEFNLNQFNQIFEKYKFEEDYEEGYSNYVGEKDSKMFSTPMNKELFQQFMVS